MRHLRESPQCGNRSPAIQVGQHQGSVFWERRNCSAATKQKWARRIAHDFVVLGQKEKRS